MKVQVSGSLSIGGFMVALAIIAHGFIVASKETVRVEVNPPTTQTAP